MRRALVVASLAALGLLARAPAGHGQDAKPAGRVVVTVSVDWEGRDLADANLEAFEELRKALPRVPITHFLNGAYYTKAGADAEAVTRSIRRVVREGDETGLHVHCWSSLVKAAGVKFKKGPTFWGGDRPLRTSRDGDVGHEVELPAYSTDEVRKIVHEGARRLRGAGLEPSASFRAGGWIATGSVLEAVRAEGFLVDSSAVDSAWHKDFEAYRLPGRIREVWPGVTPATQPFVVKTPAGSILEMPDTGALADYVPADRMREHLEDAIARARSSGRDVFAHVGFHQETAESYAGRVRDAIAALATDAPVSFVTLEEAARRARAKLGLDEKNEPH